MTQDERIQQLEKEVAQLRHDAENADAGIALILGILAGLNDNNVKLDPKTIFQAAQAKGWHATVLERFSEGKELIRRARDGQ